MARIAITLAVPNQTGGPRMAYQFARALRQRGHEVVVLHGPAHEVTADSLLDELRCIGAETRAVPILAHPVPPFAARVTRRAVRGCHAVVSVQEKDAPAALRSARAIGVPAIILGQNHLKFWGSALARWAKRLYYSRAVRACADICLCTSAVVKDQLVEMGIRPNRCVVLHPAIEISQPAGAEARARLRGQLGLHERTRVFINVGRLHVQKAQDVLLAAWADAMRHHDAALLLVGDATPDARHDTSYSKGELLDQAEKLGIADSVSLLGWRDDVHDLLAASDVYVHAARWEGPALPLAVLEAMAAERPFVITDCSGYPDGFEQSVQGMIVATGSVDELSASIRYCLDLPAEELQTMGTAARALALERYDIDDVGRRFVDIVEEQLRLHASVAI